MNASVQAKLPIGLFDSGVGGLTVLAELIKVLPHEDFLYLGDTARVPYGTKSLEIITRYAVEATTALLERKIKLLAIACNSATAALAVLQHNFSHLPIVGVIEPAARRAVECSRNKHVLVMGTHATINNRKYHEHVAALDASINVSGVPCSLLVTLAEEGWVSNYATDPVTGRNIAESVVARYLSSIYPFHYDGKIHRDGTTAILPDSVIIGCTHFPPFAPLIRQMLGPDIELVDPAVCVTHAISDVLQAKKLYNPQTAAGTLRFLVTDGRANFARVGSMFLGAAISEKDVELVSFG